MYWHARGRLKPDELSPVHVPGGLCSLAAVSTDLAATLADPSNPRHDRFARPIAENLHERALGELALLWCLWHRITSIGPGVSTVPRA